MGSKLRLSNLIGFKTCVACPIRLEGTGLNISMDIPSSAGVVKLVDTSDSKSDASDSVPVQVRPPVPYS